MIGDDRVCDGDGGGDGDGGCGLEGWLVWFVRQPSFAITSGFDGREIFLRFWIPFLLSPCYYSQS